MPLADVDKVDFEVIVSGTTAALGGTAQTTLTPLHYRRTTFATNFSATAFITAFHTAVKTAWKDSCSVSWSWDKTSIRCLNSPTETATEVTVGEAGAVAGDMLPSYVAAVMTKNTAKRGRSYRGRMYLPGIPESGTTGNAATVGEKALLDALAALLDNSVVDAAGLTYVPMVLSRVLSTLTSDPASVFATQITSIVAKSVLGRLSSRKSLVG